jgi:hypothetical protein
MFGTPIVDLSAMGLTAIFLVVGPSGIERFTDDGRHIEPSAVQT